MRRTRSEGGLTIVEVAISAALLVGVLAGANAMVSASSGVAQSTNNLGIASNKADQTLRKVADAIRRGSIASVLRLDGTYFSAGATDTGFTIREVRTYTGVPVLSSPATYQFVLPSGQLEGSIERTQDGITRVIARGVASFSVSRTGNLFTFVLQTRSGPSDDRLRSIRATLQAAARNP